MLFQKILGVFSSLVILMMVIAIIIDARSYGWMAIILGFLSFIGFMFADSESYENDELE